MLCLGEDRWGKAVPSPLHTPLLIVHGESDLRCNIVEGEQLFVALKRLGREVVFVRVPDAGHGFGALGRPRQRRAPGHVRFTVMRS